MSREPDLLFGLLALQMNFVTKEQLLESAAVWMSDPARDLGKMLFERGHLKEFQRAAVAAMVEAQLQSHGGDPSVSLAAASVDSSVREELLGLAPEDVRRSLVAKEPAQGRYSLGKELGRGGLGSVVEAFDTNLEREIALKLLLEDADGEMRERFVREAKLAGRLDHPNIVPVHDFGTLPGPRRRLFLAMKRVKGEDLGKVLHALAKGDAAARQEYSRTRLLQIFQDICLGVAFAHDRGVIHRDLKPANVMLGDYGEVLVVDWGLARVLGEPSAIPGAAPPPAEIPERADLDATIALPPPGGRASSSTHGSSSTALTFDGQILGTPAYMPPEQADGRHQDCDARSDIYALGAILYEILTNAPPLRGRTPRETLKLVLAGKIEGPSAKAAAVPPELDVICLKALAYRREDRFQDAKLLHREIQLFLEGVKERERVDKEARERIERGGVLLARYRALAGEIEAQRKAVAELAREIPHHRSAAEKRPLWDAEARLKRLEEERIEALSAASAEFGEALRAKPDSVEARDGKCELFLDRFLEAEAGRSLPEMLLNRRTLSTYDVGGRYRARLEAPGTLALRAFAFGCDCLKPVRHPSWRVRIGDSPKIPWREGRPRPDLPLHDRDRPVPETQAGGEGARWGHSAECVRREIAGAEVWIARYEERDKRLVAGEERLLGKTPLSGVTLPQGSWRCILRSPGFAPAVVPVRIDRGGSWDQEVNLYRAEEIPAGFCLVPGGPFLYGGEYAGGIEPAQTLFTHDVFVAKYSVTVGEYLDFLNDLCASGRSEEARSRQPHEGETRFLRETPSGFALPAEDDAQAKLKSPSYPIVGATWTDAAAYACWRSVRDGIPYSLPHEEEWEKSARGVDGRIYPFGDEFEASYCHTNLALSGPMRPMPVGTFEADESPYGVRDTAGCVQNWVLNSPEVPFRDYFALRGGAWSVSHMYARSAYRQGVHPQRSHWYRGFRLVVRPGG